MSLSERQMSIPQDKPNTFYSRHFLLLLIILLPVVLFLATFRFYNNRKSDIIVSVSNELSAIATLKTELILNWYKERLSDAAMLENAVKLKWFIRSKTEEKHTTETEAAARHLIESVVTLKNYRSATLFDTSRRIHLTTSVKNDCPHHDYFHSLLDSVVKSGTVIITGIHSSNKQTIHLWLFIPIKKVHGSGVSGIVVLEIDPERFLFPLIQSLPLKSNTVEVLLLQQNNDSVLFLNTLRHTKNQALPIKLPSNLIKLPATKAVSGFTGTMDGIDYRGKKVLASVRNVPGTSWFMIAKIDFNEALYETRIFFGELILLLAFTIIVITLSAGAYHWHQSADLYKKIYRTEKQQENLLLSLKHKDERCNALFKSMTEGVAVHELVFDEKGTPIDYIVTDVNPSFEQHTGISPEKARNTKGSVLYETGSPPYLCEYADVGISGRPLYFETFFAPLNKHFAISVCNLGENRFGTIFEDITARKITERERENTITLLNLLNTANDVTNAIKSSISSIKT